MEWHTDTIVKRNATPLNPFTIQKEELDEVLYGPVQQFLLRLSVHFSTVFPRVRFDGCLEGLSHSDNLLHLEACWNIRP